MAESPSMVANALGSAISGIFSRILTHPLDTAKARLQAPSSQYTSVGQVLSRTWRSEGLRGLYRGLDTVLIAGTPGTILYLCSYEWIKTRFENDSFITHFAAGMLAETIACIIYVPVDVVKERMQINASYLSSWDALQQTLKHEGMTGIYRGYGATLASFGPFSAFYFVFYEEFKSLSRSKLDKTELPFRWIVLCSASSGALASWLTSPLDMAKLRLQVQRGNISRNTESTEVVYRGVVDCLQHSYRQAGVRGLFRGAGARVIHFAPATTVSMTTFEMSRSFVGKCLP